MDAAEQSEATVGDRFRGGSLLYNPLKQKDMFANVMLVASIATFAIVVKEIHSYFKEVNE